MNISIIGNGVSALLTKTGHFIDQCDIVVRFGLYETNGYEEFVGSKTNICGTAKWKYKERSSDIEQWLVEDIDESYNDDLKNMLGYEKYGLTKGKTFETHRPTIGIRFLHKILKEFPESKIYVKGFDFLSTGHYFNKDHTYFEYCSHPIILEKLFFNKLLRENKIFKI